MTSNCGDGRGNMGVHCLFVSVITLAFPGVRATSRDYAFSNNKRILERTGASKEFTPILWLHSSDSHLSPFDVL